MNKNRPRVKAPSEFSRLDPDMKFVATGEAPAAPAAGQPTLAPAPAINTTTIAAPPAPASAQVAVVDASAAPAAAAAVVPAPAPDTRPVSVELLPDAAPQETPAPDAPPVAAPIPAAPIEPVPAAPAAAAEAPQGAGAEQPPQQPAEGGKTPPAAEIEPPWADLTGLNETNLLFKIPPRTLAKMNWVMDNVPKMSKQRLVRDGLQAELERLIAIHYKP